MTTDHPLDGAYRITSTSTGLGDKEKRSDGETRIENSRTERMDHAWCKWTSTFQIIAEDKVRMTSVADPSQAAIDFMLTKPDGTPTREPVTYEAELKLARKDDKIQMSGQIEYAGEVVFLTMRKIGD
jgi:hypothetical protein